MLSAQPGGIDSCSGSRGERQRGIERRWAVAHEWIVQEVYARPPLEDVERAGLWAGVLGDRPRAHEADAGPRAAAPIRRDVLAAAAVLCQVCLAGGGQRGREPRARRLDPRAAQLRLASGGRAVEQAALRRAARPHPVVPAAAFCRVARSLDHFLGERQQGVQSCASVAAAADLRAPAAVFEAAALLEDLLDAQDAAQREMAAAVGGAGAGGGDGGGGAAALDEVCERVVGQLARGTLEVCAEAARVHAFPSAA